MAFNNKVNISIDDATLATNINFLSPLGFRLLLKRAPTIEYFCQEVTLPSMSMTEINTPTPFGTIPLPGGKITYEPLTVRFRLDEEMVNYREIFNWIVALGHPDNLSQYAALQNKIYSDGSIIINTSNNNPKLRIVFENMFPISLTPLSFDVSASGVDYLEATVTFSYRKFTVETL